MKKITKKRIHDYLYSNSSELTSVEIEKWFTENELPSTESGNDIEQEVGDFWQHSYKTASMLPKEIEASYKNTTGRLGLGNKAAVANRRLRPLRIMTRIAAILMLPLLVTSIILLGRLSAPEKEIAWIEVYTKYGEKQQVTLPDGSQIWVNAGTKLLYPESFEKERRVFVSGEIYLDIQPDPDKKFLVETRNMAIRVHGTKFNVRSYPEDILSETTLLEGSISLRPRNGSGTEDFYLKSGEKVLVDNHSGEISVERFNVNNYASWRHGQYSYRHKTLDEITADLERIFDVQIVIRDRSLLDDRYFVTFALGLTLDEMLEAMNINNLLEIKRDRHVIEIARNPHQKRARQ